VHLDEERREALFAAVTKLGAPVWMTGTDAGYFIGLEAARYRIQDSIIDEL
jgi:DNA replication and repair protein RecF